MMPSRVLDQANAAQAKRSNPENEDYYIPNYQIVAATNADGFNMSNGTPSGVLVMDGIEWNAPNGNGFFGITKEGKAVIGTTEEYNTIYKDQIRDAVSGFGITLVKDGKVNIAHTDNYTADRASRTAVGITKTGKVVCMVLDGRQEPVSCGGSMVEIAQIMMEAGCVDAINLDGGGSTTFVSKPEGSDELQVTNKPSDGYARNVSSSLIIVSTAPSSTAFDHAIIESDYNYSTVGTPVQLTAAGVSATGNEAEMPEGYTWAVSDEAMAEVTEDGLFTGLEEGPVTVYLMLDEEIIGSKTMTMVTPTSLYFTRKNMSVVYGSTITLPVAALYEGKPAAINEDDVTLTASVPAAGVFDGFKFTASESTYKATIVTAQLVSDETIRGTITVNLYNQGENTFDFDKADGGDEQLAWTRTVTNATFDGKMVYAALDREKNMDVSYIFAVDMSQLTMPDRLAELTYMLPGADDPNASAWNFLLQLAERISVLTEVTAKIKFDDRFDVDLSQMKIINEYFYQANDPVVDEETNEITLTMKWKDQTAAIPADEANPMCIINGIKLTAKEGVNLKDLETVNVTNSGSVSYRVYLRANALYSFCQDPVNQEQFGLMPFQNDFIDANGEEKFEQGGYFVNDEYKKFEDFFTMSYAMNQGWVKEDGGWAYYVNDEALTGVQKIDGFYYDFGEDGLNDGQTKFNGIFTDEEGNMHYVRTGKIVTTGWTKVDEVGYHCHSNGCIFEATIADDSDCTHGSWVVYTCSDCGANERVGDYVFPNGHDWDENYKCRICNHKGQDINDATVKLVNKGEPTDPGKSYYYQSGGTRLGAYVTFDGEYILSYSNDNNVNSDHTMRDLYVIWTNDRGIGKVTLTIDARGNYYGATSMDYYIVPTEVKDLTAETVGEDAVLLKWTRGNNGVDGADGYKIYLDDGKLDKYGKLHVSSGDKLIADVTGTSYVATGLEAGDHTFYVVAYAASDNESENGKIYNCPTGTNKLKLANATTETTVPEMEEPEVELGETENEAKVTVTFDSEPKTDGSWNVIVVAYDEFGMMVSVTSETITGESLTVALKDIQSAGRVAIYVVNSNSSPLLAPAVIDLASGAVVSEDIDLLSFVDFFEEDVVYTEDAVFAGQE